MSLTKKIESKIASIAAISHDLPSVIIIHNLSDRSVAWMSERGLKILNTSLKEIKDLGPAYFEKFFNPVDAENYTPLVLGMLERNDLNEVVSYFQQVRGSDIEEYGWYLSASKVLLNDDEGKPCLAITAAHPVDQLTSFTYKIERLLEEQELMRTNLFKFTKLTKREKEIIKYLVQGLNSGAISEKIFISPSTVEQHRKNIKSKLDLKSMPELVKFAQVFNIV